MQYTILLDKNESTKQVAAQEQARFIKSILEALEVPLDWNPDEPLSVDKKIELLKILSNYNINIIDNLDGEISIYVNTDLIAEWKKCKYKLKRDLTQIDPKKKLYIEMEVSFWSIFENERTDNTETL